MVTGRCLQLDINHHGRRTSDNLFITVELPDYEYEHYDWISEIGYTLYTANEADNDVPLQSHAVQFSSNSVPFLRMQYVKRNYLGERNRVSYMDFTAPAVFSRNMTPQMGHMTHMILGSGHIIF